MKFTTTIKDMNSQEWNFEGEVVGKGMYDDQGDKSGLVVEDFDIEFITLTRGDTVIVVRNLAVMPDRFSQSEIGEVSRLGRDEFLNDWMDVQDCAHDLISGD